MDSLASLALAPEVLDAREVVPPGPGRPQGVRVHDAQVIPGLQVAAGAQGHLQGYKAGCQF